MLREKKPQEARHNRAWCCAGLAVACLYSLEGTSDQNNWKCSVRHRLEEPVIGQSGRDKGSSGGDVLKFTSNCHPRVDT